MLFNNPKYLEKYTCGWYSVCVCVVIIFQVKIFRENSHFNADPFLPSFAERRGGCGALQNLFFTNFCRGFLFCFWQEPYQVKLCMTQQKSLDNFVNLDVT